MASRLLGANSKEKVRFFLVNVSKLLAFGWFGSDPESRNFNLDEKVTRLFIFVLKLVSYGSLNLQRS